MHGDNEGRASPRRSRDDTDAQISSKDPSAAISDRDLDDTYRVFREVEHLEFSEEDSKRVRRKIDLHIVPILVVTYGLQYLDKNSINFANAFGLQDGTNLTGQDYSWLGWSLDWHHLFS